MTQFNSKEQVLQACTVEGLMVKLPNQQLDRKLYQDVAKALQLIGGKWKGGKVQAFVFESNPTDLLSQIANGEKRNLKKEYQFFPTPPDIADYMIERAFSIVSPVGFFDNTKKILEPSAGQGAIIDAIVKKLGNVPIYGFELMDINRKILNDKYPNLLLSPTPDFLSKDKKMPFKFDVIIANPPFSKNQDIDHIREMVEHSKQGGVVVTLASTHWINSSNKKEKEFKIWLDRIGAHVEHIKAGAFKSSGTLIETVIITIPN